MLILQHIWSRWTTESRGADAPLRRPRFEVAYALPAALAGTRGCSSTRSRGTCGFENGDLLAGRRIAEPFDYSYIRLNAW
jgi:hypothetical protein